LRGQNINEVVFPVVVSEDLLMALRGHEVAVLGGDFWQQIDDGLYVPVYENWFVNRRPEESPELYCSRSIDRAIEKVKSYKDTGYSVTFTCTVMR
jgi:Immunity protein 40